MILTFACDFFRQMGRLAKLRRSFFLSSTKRIFFHAVCEMFFLSVGESIDAALPSLPQSIEPSFSSVEGNIVFFLWSATILACLKARPGIYLRRVVCGIPVHLRKDPSLDISLIPSIFLKFMIEPRLKPAPDLFMKALPTGPPAVLKSALCL